MKQELWIQNLQMPQSFGFCNIMLNITKNMLNYPNIPRKLSKFENFMQNSLKIRDRSMVSQIWELMNGEEKEISSGDTQNEPNNEKKIIDGQKLKEDFSEEKQEATIKTIKKKLKNIETNTDEFEINPEGNNGCAGFKKRKKSEKIERISENLLFHKDNDECNGINKKIKVNSEEIQIIYEANEECNRTKKKLKNIKTNSKVTHIDKHIHCNGFIKKKSKTMESNSGKIHDSNGDCNEIKKKFKMSDRGEEIFIFENNCNCNDGEKSINESNESQKVTNLEAIGKVQTEFNWNTMLDTKLEALMKIKSTLPLVRFHKKIIKEYTKWVNSEKIKQALTKEDIMKKINKKLKKNPLFTIKDGLICRI
ncbi:cell growth-regulating nucleolar protein-like [Gordionus sp. m RMFG-2023]|uniref:cell growth-regulating nucleolar protein-like n=1 Tax=Gordionus sp. m RMFG-2023 TaxID=3053472 RepID=UPI0031FDECD6